MLNCMCFEEKNGQLGGNSAQMVQVGHFPWLSGLLESGLCLHSVSAAGQCVLGSFCHMGVTGTLRHRRAINGNCVRSSLGGDRQHLCSALSQLLVLPPGEGSTAQRERLSCSLPHGPWTEVAQQQQLEHSSWLLPLPSREQAWGYPPAPSAEDLQRSQRGYRSIHCFSQHTSQHQKLTLEAV